MIASVIARYDGISTAVRHTAATLRQSGGFDVDIFTPRSDFPELRAHRVETAAALRAHRAYRAADLAIYHFGIFSPLFEEMAGNEGPRHRVVAFHNVTPSEFVAPAQRPIVERSLRQMAAARQVDRLWAESPTSVDTLMAEGVSRQVIDMIPPAVYHPSTASLADKPSSPIRLLFVGRVVRAKGVLDLVEAVDLARNRTRAQFQLDIAGNQDFSDPSYAAEVKTAVVKRDLTTRVRFLGAVDNQRLDALYRSAHLLLIPSYHEGFCRPVVEGLRAGCVPVGYAAFNLPHVAHGLGRMVPVGDRAALAAALVELIDAFASSIGRRGLRLLPLDGAPLSPEEFDSAAQSYVREFSFERVAAAKLRSVQSVLAG